MAWGLVAPEATSVWVMATPAQPERVQAAPRARRVYFIWLVSEA